MIAERRHGLYVTIWVVLHGADVPAGKVKDSSDFMGGRVTLCCFSFCTAGKMPDGRGLPSGVSGDQLFQTTFSRSLSIWSRQAVPKKGCLVAQRATE